MYNCKQVVKIVSSEENTSLVKKLKVFFHLMICKYCHRYVQHLGHIKQGFRKMRREKEKAVSSETIRQLEEKIIKKI